MKAFHFGRVASGGSADEGGTKVISGGGTERKSASKGKEVQDLLWLALAEHPMWPRPGSSSRATGERRCFPPYSWGCHVKAWAIGIMGAGQRSAIQIDRHSHYRPLYLRSMRRRMIAYMRHQISFERFV